MPPRRSWRKILRKIRPRKTLGHSIQRTICRRRKAMCRQLRMKPPAAGKKAPVIYDAGDGSSVAPDYSTSAYGSSGYVPAYTYNPDLYYPSDSYYPGFYGGFFIFDSGFHDHHHHDHDHDHHHD